MYANGEIGRVPSARGAGRECPAASCPTLSEVVLEWSGRWESNPRLKLGKLGYYHYTTPAPCCILVAAAAKKKGAPRAPLQITDLLPYLNL
jgi:hypothetical protein